MAEETKTQAKPKKKRGRNAKRVREIVKVLRQYDVLKALSTQTHPENVRKALEALGPTFIKIGQMLSTRPDIVSPAFIAELSKLQDDVGTDSFATVQQTIQTEFGKPVTELFQDFADKPIASASMGQVHLAHMQNGVKVAVKIQHPGIAAVIHTDLRILDRLVRVVKWLPTAQVVDPKEIFAQFKVALEKELDSKLEAENNARFYKLNNKQDIFEVPQVYLDYCSSKVVTTEYKVGRSMGSYLKAIAGQPITDKRRNIAKALVNNFMKQVFDDGFFHADPHPGNILLRDNEPDFGEFGAAERPQLFNKISRLPNYRLIYLDFGMVGTLDQGLIDNLAAVVMAINSRDAYKIGNGLLNICKVVGPLDKNKFFEELSAFLEPYYNSGLGTIDLENMTLQIVELCRRNYLQMNPDVTLLMKAFGTLEGVVLQLDPDISMLEVARPFTRHYIMKTVNVRNEIEDQLLAAYQLSKDVPLVASRLKTSLDLLERGRLKLGIELKNRDQVLDRIEAMVNRIVVGLILAALIVGSSMLVQNQAQQTWIARLGILGYIVAAIFILGFLVGGLWTHWKRWRARRQK